MKKKRNILKWFYEKEDQLKNLLIGSILTAIGLSIFVYGIIHISSIYWSNNLAILIQSNELEVCALVGGGFLSFASIALLISSLIALKKD